MIEIKPMDESYIHIDCLHFGPVDPSSPPRREGLWQDAPDLPPHPWSDEIIAKLAKKYRSISKGWVGDPGREFMREMIQRHGTCAMLAWEDGLVVGQLRFYPLSIAQLLAKADAEKQHFLVDFGVMNFDPDPKILWVLCVMTCQPYVTSASQPILPPTPPIEGGPAVSSESGQPHYRTSEEAGARKGIGQKLIQGLIDWARENGWKRIVKQAHADLDCMYGEYGGGGEAFWAKAGFEVIGSHYDEWPNEDDWKVTVESQAAAKGMSTEDAWTWRHMTYEV